MRASLFMIALIFAIILSIIAYLPSYYIFGVSDMNVTNKVCNVINSIIMSPGNYNVSNNNKNISRFKLKVGKFYFVNNTVIIKANFKPKNAYIKYDNHINNLTFNYLNGSYLAKFNPKVVGVYRIVADNISTNFTVDSYKINARIVNYTIIGNIYYHYMQPRFIEYRILPINKCIAKKRVINGSFKIPLTNPSTGKYKVILRCGNAKLVLNFTVKGWKIVDWKIVR